MCLAVKMEEGGHGKRKLLDDGKCKETDSLPEPSERNSASPTP